MNPLVVFYSRKGRTKQIGKLLSSRLKCESEELFDTKKRTGFIIGFFKCGFDARKEKLTILQETQKKSELYDLIILGTPNWGRKMTPATRTYITDNRTKFKNVAFYCTEAGSGGPEIFKSMAKLCEKEPLSTLEITKKDIKEGTHIDKINSFIQEISNN